MKTLTILIFIISLIAVSCTGAKTETSTTKMKLEHSIKVWRGENESIVIIPKGSDLPASGKEVFVSDQDHSLIIYFFKETGEEMNENNLVGEFWFNQFKESRTASEVEIEVTANSDTETTIKAIDVETGNEKTMIFLESQNGTKQVEVEQHLAKSFHKLKSTGGEVNYAIFMLNNGYFVQIATGKDENLVRCEASVSNGGSDGNYEKTSLSSIQIEQLKVLGWQPPEFGELNFYYWDTINSSNTLDQIASNFLETINSTYQGAQIKSTTINLEVNQNSSN